MNAKKAISTSVFSIISNALLAVIKFATGILGNSYALIADAIESTADVFSSVLVLIGLKYSTRPADKNHPYGHGRFEVISTFAVIGFLVISATVIAYESIENIRTPHPAPETFTLYVLGAIILFKELSCNQKEQRNQQFIIEGRCLAPPKRCDYFRHGFHRNFNCGNYGRRLRSGR
jgi:cation diffusion facilitator family transporter